MPKKLVVLCDGTGKQYGDCNTNVVHAYERLMGQSAGQVVMYDPGVGTFAPHAVERHVGDTLGRWLSKAFGYGLRQNLQDTYRFLMDYHEEDDEVFLIGFSRGAFTVRCLAGLLMRCGLLWPHEQNLLPYAIRYYFKTWDQRTRREADQEIVAGFRATFTRPCVPKVVAVWDTVNSYGLVGGAKFPNARLHPDIPFGFQALALDEFRVKFKPSLWEPPAEGQTIEQVWFAGAHSDVGGGYFQRGLSDIALVWLLEQAEGQGLRLVDAWKDRLNPDPCGTMHDEAAKTGWRLVNGAYALFGKKGARDIPADARFHPAVQTRREARPSYKPGSRGT